MELCPFLLLEGEREEGWKVRQFRERQGEHGAREEERLEKKAYIRYTRKMAEACSCMPVLASSLIYPYDIPVR